MAFFHVPPKSLRLFTRPPQAVFFHYTQKNRQIISGVDPYSLNANTVPEFQVNPDRGF
jgi:hypothetical protein